MLKKILIYTRRVSITKSYCAAIGEQVRLTLDYYNDQIAQVIQIFGHIEKQVKQSPVLKFMHYADEKNFSFVMQASEGDKESLQKLSKIWWRRLFHLYAIIEKHEGKKTNAQGFQTYIHEHCWEIVTSIENKPISYQLVADIPEKIYYSLSKNLRKKLTESFEQGVSLTITDEETVSFENYQSEDKLVTDISPSRFLSNKIYMYNGREYLFIDTISRISGVSDQTLRNWVRDGKIKGEKIHYFSSLRKSYINPWILRYEEGLLQKIEHIKQLELSVRNHTKEGYVTIGQLAKLLHRSRRTLQRWVEDGKIKPTIKQNGIPLYSNKYARELYQNLHLK